MTSVRGRKVQRGIHTLQSDKSVAVLEGPKGMSRKEFRLLHINSRDAPVRDNITKTQDTLRTWHASADED